MWDEDDMIKAILAVLLQRAGGMTIVTAEEVHEVLGREFSWSVVDRDALLSFCDSVAEAGEC